MRCSAFYFICFGLMIITSFGNRPFARLWWDETVPTVVTRAEPHNQAIMHPEQDRVLTIRENARLQGFPDYYQLCGPIKERLVFFLNINVLSFEYLQ